MRPKLYSPCPSIKASSGHGWGARGGLRNRVPAPAAPPISTLNSARRSNGAQSRAGRRYRVQHAPRGQRRCCRPLAKGGLNKQGIASIDARATSGVLCDSTAMATAARGLLRTVVLPPPGSCGRNATYPGNRVDDRLPLFALRLFPRIIFAGWEGDGDMSEDSKRWLAAKPNTSEGRGAPDLESLEFSIPQPKPQRAKTCPPRSVRQCARAR
jgi:hypothetical protein